MSKIKKLSSSIIKKIAAGEVIERPAFAVKELVENSIDAKAKNIIIELEQGGIRKFIIKDDGEGMSRQDLELSVQSHTTSKLSDEEMLEKIQTLGFRGEALASIAAVSKLSIQSRLIEEPGGTIIEILENKVENISAIGMPFGTQVVVKNIFDNMPARKKFMKSPQVEFRFILDLLIKIAISFSNIGFKLINNKKVIFNVPENQELFERIATLLGTSTSDYLIPLAFEDSYIKISGFIAKPQLQSKDINKEFIFINNRSVGNKLISSAARDAYGELLETTSYPIFLIFLEMPYEIIDVNVHPRKEEVHFTDNSIVYNAIYTSLKQSLFQNNLTFENITWKNSEKGLTKSFSGKLLKQKLAEETNISTSSNIIQLQQTYLVTQTKNGIILIDQHAASERIYYEKFKNLFEKEKKKEEKYLLRNLQSFNVSLSEKEALIQNINFLTKIGFEIEHFRDNTFHITSVPLLFKDRNAVEIIIEMIEDITEKNIKQSIDRKTIKMLQFLACRTAIKAGDKITKNQAKKLIKQLEKTKNSYVCAHGRPTKIEITKYELEKMFKRV